MPYIARLMLQNPKISAAFAALVIGAFGLTAALAARDSEPVALPVAAPVQITRNDAILSEADAARYRAIFAAQEEGKFDRADDVIAQLDNQALLGYVLAQRYRDSRYHATTAELDSWLTNFGDHPGASRIAGVARSRGPQLAHNNTKALKGDGYTDHLGRTAMPAGWHEALRLWKNENYDDALPRFMAVGENEKLSPWQRAAGYYWAYRTADKLEDSAAARSALIEASSFKTTFYGLLANAARGSLNSVDATAPRVSVALRNAPHAIRASLLAQLGRDDQAEDELRLLYGRTDAADRPGIITLASELNLPNLQVRLAQTPGLTPEEKLFASYPRPDFMASQQKIDPALLMAIARNESTFRSDVGSTAGAQGMMQMLPSTARAVERRVKVDLAAVDGLDTITERLGDPATSVRYGAEYLKILRAEPGINGNLVRLLAGYNAGPGAVAGWSKSASDPLLYIESIPYAETRNYVMQVLAQYWIYQSLMDEQPRTLAAIADGEWPQV